MTKKTKTAPTIKDKDTLRVSSKAGENADKAFARVMAMPETQAARTLRQWQDLILPDGIDINETISELRKQTEAVKAGDMSRAEEMLLSQAHTLNELFNHLARKAHAQQYIPNYETFLKMAFKAQNQCRMTLETLSNIKNPPVVYARQANFANGPQQINNGTHAEETQNQQNKLLENIHGERLDIGTKVETSGTHSAMATLETVNRT